MALGKGLQRLSDICSRLPPPTAHPLPRIIHLLAPPQSLLKVTVQRLHRVPHSSACHMLRPYGVPGRKWEYSPVFSDPQPQALLLDFKRVYVRVGGPFKGAGLSPISCSLVLGLRPGLR